MTSLLVLGRMRSRGLDASIGAGGPFVVRPRKHTLAEQMFLVASEDARVLADADRVAPWSGFHGTTCEIFILDKTQKKHSPQNPPGE